MQVTPREFRKWLTQPMSSRQRVDMGVLAYICDQYGLTLGSDGRLTMTTGSKEAALDVSERRAGRLMRVNGVKMVRMRKHKVGSSGEFRRHCVIEVATLLLGTESPLGRSKVGE